MTDHKQVNTSLCCNVNKFTQHRLWNVARCIKHKQAFWLACVVMWTRSHNKLMLRVELWNVVMWTTQHRLWNVARCIKHPAFWLACVVLMTDHKQVNTSLCCNVNKFHNIDCGMLRGAWTPSIVVIWLAWNVARCIKHPAFWLACVVLMTDTSLCCKTS